MDFFSLFDPSEESQSKKTTNKNQNTEQDTVKKKTEGGKGRRRGRRPQVTSENLSEESSFLCEPDLSNEVLVKHGSYIDSYLYKPWNGNKSDVNSKPTCRNTGRKNRRRKSLTPKNSISEHDENSDSEFKTKYWNNKKNKPRNCDGSVGKHVNDLTNKNDENNQNVNDSDNDINDNNDTSRKDSNKNNRKADTSTNDPNKNNRKADTSTKDSNKNNRKGDTSIKDSNKNEVTTDTFNDNARFESFKDGNGNERVGKSKTLDTYVNRRKDVNNVVDKLDKANIIDDLYVSGDLSELDDDLYSSDSSDDSYDSDTELSDNYEEYGRLPPEPRFGNVEYKLQLIAPGEKRFQHLVTQMKWRVLSGGGCALYVLGVRDDGVLVGLRRRAARASLATLRALAGEAGARCRVGGVRGERGRTVREVWVLQTPDCQQSVELRIAVMGANEAGKSTLIGVLTQGELDNGAGSARLNMFRHLHEVRSGRTSSLSHEILGFDKQGNVVNYGCCALMTAARIGAVSERLVSFVDQPGHSKYQRTTLRGLSGYEPHYAVIVVSATHGITPITEEHLSIVLALNVPFFIVINKCELANSAVPALMKALGGIITGKKLVLVTDDDYQKNGSQGGATNDNGDDAGDDQVDDDVMYVFAVSCVSAAGLRSLHSHLRRLAARAPPDDYRQKETCEFQIDEIFHIGDNGPIVGGLLAKGQLFEGDDVIIGPLENGEFAEITVKSIYRNRVPCGSVRAGQSASLGLSPGAKPRPGMVLLAAPSGRARISADAETAVFPTTTTCRCIDHINQLKNKMASLNKNQKNKKNIRRKDKNILNDLTKAQNCLTKVDYVENSNLYQCGEEIEKESEKEKEKEREKEGDGAEIKEVCDHVILEDPNDPRGCIYFQATVQVLRHATAICPGFQCTVHVGNVRQTAIIEGILSPDGTVREGERASCVFRFVRCPEYVRPGRRLLFTQGLATRAIGQITQVFPYFPSLG